LVRIVIVVVLFMLIGYIVDRTSEVILGWLANAVNGANDALSAALRNPPWRTNEFSGIFCWPSTVMLIIWGLGLAAVCHLFGNFEKNER